MKFIIKMYTLPYTLAMASRNNKTKCEMLQK